MTFYIENETDTVLDFDIEAVAAKAAEQALALEQCPYETEVNVLLTDNEGIRRYNKDYRNIDSPTDVLSFPNIEYDVPGNFAIVEENEADYFQPDTGELILGDIIISVDKVIEQAERYGHSRLREFTFLVTHSMLHLCGYDHMEADEADVMEAKQEAVLEALHITRTKSAAQQRHF